MRPVKSLPYASTFESAEEYVTALLQFITTSDMLQVLCGGVHILDFLTSKPDLYETIVPAEWRAWFRMFDIPDILDLLMREDLVRLLSEVKREESSGKDSSWRNGPLPPESLLDYVQSVRSLTLDRSFQRSQHEPIQDLSRQIAVGMKPKKVHEVQNFAAFLEDLISSIASRNVYRISHIVDFGSGQNYLGRVLASSPYNKRIVAVECKQTNIAGAMDMDISARLSRRKFVLVDKKMFRSELAKTRAGNEVKHLSTMETDVEEVGNCNILRESSTNGCDLESSESSARGTARIQYIKHAISGGDLEFVIDKIQQGPTPKADLVSLASQSDECCLYEDHKLLVTSLHSCGNLSHHGLRTLVMNSSVKAVAVVGCCYNLVTERLGSPIPKLLPLRSPHRRLEETSSASDPHGFPLSEHFATYRYKGGEGLRLNITARMMAVQAPRNWSAAACESFFARHFFRALLQRIFLDRGFLTISSNLDTNLRCGSPRGWCGTWRPIIIGSLRKSCYKSFPAYVQGAVAKLEQDPQHRASLKRCMKDLRDEEILAYEQRYLSKKHELSVLWSLMAFSAELVESAIVVDRWKYLREQDSIRDCWVQTVFDYKQSPRNLVVVGIKA